MNDETEIPVSLDSVAIVTGAARGIGAAIAHELAGQGHAVALVDLDGAGAEEQAAQLRAKGAKAHTIGADISDEQAVQATVEEVAEALGPPTVLVNNAGVTRDNLLFKMALDDWDTVMRVHLRGSFLMTRATQRYMVDAKYGRIVNISSSSALGNRGQSNYAAAKAGLQGFTKTLALELGPFGVTANSVAPGFIVSDMTRATAERIGVEWGVYLAERVSQIPVRRAGEPDDIASLVGFLCSPRAGYVSGQVIYVAGGPRG